MPAASAMPGGGYRSSREHLLDELTRLDVVLRDRIIAVRERVAAPPEPLAGYFIPEAEIDALLAAPALAWADAWEPSPAAAGLRAAIDERVAATVAAGEVRLRLVALAERFGLDRLEADIVVCCLAAEVDRRYERFYGYLQDDVTRRAPSVDLLLTLTCPDPCARWQARHRFGPGGPLVRHELAVVEPEPGRPSVSLLDRPVLLASRIAGFLLDDDALDPGLRAAVQVIDPASAPIDPLLATEPGERLAALADSCAGRLLGYLRGGPGTGRRQAAEACARHEGRELLVVRTAGPAGAGDPAELLGAVVREGRLRAAALYLADADALLDGAPAARLDAVRDALERYPHTVFLAGAGDGDVTRLAGDRLGVTVGFDPPDAAERARLWRLVLGPAAGAAGADPELLAGTFRLSAGQIGAAARAARDRAAVRDPEHPTPTQDDLLAACRARSGQTLATVARRVRLRHGWDDLVLPPDQRRRLAEIADQIRFRAVVQDTWGFADRVAAGRGLNLLFAGPPGTGKTMAASVLARTVGVDLYAIDLAATVSKYIGETEKQLERIFDEAQAGHAMLLFDEADALFGKRTSVRDAHDRYANLETSYLLQKLENHDGVVILATNLRKNMDDAFVRRLHATVDFALPGAAERLRIWQGSWPSRAPRDPDVDLDALARAVEVSGGNIRNIVLAGAFLAAADGGVITMAHLVEATRAEYRKLGTLLAGGELDWG
jgi:hypothetical protein